MIEFLQRAWNGWKALPSLRRACVIVVLGYVAVFGTLLWQTQGLPYVIDNNESFSNLWHARSLYKNGVAQTKGLTDEVFAHHAAASPHIHSHQGNFPRLFTFFLYLFGLRSVEAHLWVTTFTVGLLAMWFAFRFISQLGPPLLAAVVCLVLTTDYLLVVQWHANLYHVWHLFFFFSSLLCVHGVGGERRRLWTALTVLNFACFFYWEYVFTAFVTLLAAGYALLLYWRRPGTFLRAWLAIGAGAALTVIVLFSQLTAYMGWENVLRDVRYTFTARNSAKDPEYFQEIINFYREHRIIFWQNFQDTSALRSVQGFVDSVFGRHLIYYTPALAAAMLLVGAAWLLSLPRCWAGARARNLLTPSRRRAWFQEAANVVRVAIVTAALALAGSSALAAFWPENTFTTIPRWCALIGATLILGRAWTGCWWGWPRLRTSRLLVLLGYAAAARWFLELQTRLYDPDFISTWREATGYHDTGWQPTTLVLGAVLVGMTLIVFGSRALLGRSERAVASRLALLVPSGLVAYIIVYRIFTGYIYTGYLARQVPLLVFVTDLTLAVCIFVMLRLVIWCWQHRPRPASGIAKYFALPNAAVVTALALTLLCIGSWLDLQSGYVDTVPPDRYSFLKLLDKPPFVGHSVVTNDYPAPMAWKMGSWGYPDTTLLWAPLTLDGTGYQIEREHKYLWFADRDTNLDYLKPDFAIIAVHPTNTADAITLATNKLEASPSVRPEQMRLVRRAGEMQPFLHDRVAGEIPYQFSAVKFDWDYPPFLRPVDEELFKAVGALPIRGRIAVSQAGQKLRWRWRIEIEPLLEPGANDQPQPEIVLLDATADGKSIFAKPTGWTPRVRPNGEIALAGHSGPDATPILETVADGRNISLRFLQSSRGGKARVTINDVSDVLDFRSAQVAERRLDFSADQPHGKFTLVPVFPPGLYVRTTLTADARGVGALVEYRYAHQENLPEADTALRLYLEEQPDRWRLLDCITFLGPKGFPVRLEEFRQKNPDVTALYALAAGRGDQRAYIAWLSDYLAKEPAALRRPGVVAAALGPEVEPDQTKAISRRMPLPPDLKGRLQVSVMPATSTKSGPEYFGLIFSARDLSKQVAGRPLALNPAEVEPLIGSALPYGKLKLRVKFPVDQFPRAEPLVTTGVEQDGDFVYVTYTDANHIILGFDHWFKGGPVTRPITIDYSRDHEIEISIGSLFPPPEDVVFAGMDPTTIAELTQKVIVKLDGATVINARSDFFESLPSRVTVGANTINGTSCGPAFTGKILSAERVWPNAQ